MAVAALVVVLLALLGSTPTDARSTESPSKRWPQFYADDWDDVDAVYSSDVKVKWMAPFFSGTGLGNEASLMALGVDKYLANKLVIDQHGDKTNFRFVNGILKSRHRQLVKMQARSAPAAASTLYICQSDPDAWSPKPLRLPANRCPSGGALYKIGRTHIHSNKLPKEWTSKLNQMDEVWVPSRYHQELFARQGVRRDKIVVVPQPADLDFFNPARTAPIELPGAKPESFRFFSIMEWEHRKGWDLLLRAFLSEFSRDEEVTLYLLTPKHKTTEDVWTFLGETLDVSDMRSLPEIEALSYKAQRDMPSVYKAMDAFVLPTRGEGWGRTITEAMCMELPVIATKWSGQLDYMTDRNSFGIPVSHMTAVPDSEIYGEKMAEPDIYELRRLMREVFEDPTSARRRGARARIDMYRYSPERVGRFVAHHLGAITDSVGPSDDDEL